MESEDSSITVINGFLLKHHDRQYLVSIYTTEDDPWRSHCLQINPNPHQSFGGYLSFLFIMLGCVFMELQVSLRYDIIDKNQSPFEINSLFMITSIVALSVAVVATGVMILTYYYFRKMENIHYTILKIVGCYSAILATFSLGMVLYAPRSMSNWPIWYPFSCLSLFGIVLAIYYYYFFSKESSEASLPLTEHLSPFGWCYLLPPGSGIRYGSVFIRESSEEDRKFPKIYYAGVLVPVSLALVLFVPNNLHHCLVFSAFSLFYLISSLKMFLVVYSFKVKLFPYSKETMTRIVLRRSRYTFTYEIIPGEETDRF